ncbi:hypothetical protein RB195_014537 [Necator americanus]|uniref:Uncharacterized protein n=1 Tax=Necator americanus TaxID=51031 RepID=A0ABR1E0Y8_NECAM
MDNIDDRYERLVDLHDCTRGTKSFKIIKRRLSPKTLELIRQRGAAQAADNKELTPKIARFCREAIKEDLKERRAEMLTEEAGQNGRYARQNFANSKTTTTALWTPNGTTASKRDGKDNSRLLLRFL